MTPRAGPTGRSPARRRRAGPSRRPRPARPPSSCEARAGDTPGRRRALRGGQPRPAAAAARRARRGAGPGATYGPSELGAAPQTRASERKRLARPDRRGPAGPALGSSRHHPGHLGADVLARRLHVLRRGGSPASRSRVSRPAPSGSETATSGSSSTPPAISSEPPPMSSDQQPPRRPAEPAPDGEERQPGLVAAGQHPQVDAGLGADPARARPRRCGASRRAEVAKASISSTPWSSATSRHDSTNRTSASAPSAAIGPSGPEVLGELQLDLVRGRRQRPGAAVGVHDEQVHGVRADVEHPQPHGADGTHPSEPTRERADAGGAS